MTHNGKIKKSLPSKVQTQGTFRKHDLIMKLKLLL